jgi:hypothetical protein
VARGHYERRELATEHLEKEGTEGTELDGSAIRVRMERTDVRNGKVVWRRCSRVAFIGRERRKGGGQGVIRQQLGGA